MSRDMIVVSAEQYAERNDAELADTRSATPNPGGGVVPGGLAGYAHDGAHYCPECAEDVTVEVPEGGGEIPMTKYPPFETDPHGFGVGIVTGFDEIDGGGACHVCHRLLNTNVLLYGHDAVEFRKNE